MKRDKYRKIWLRLHKAYERKAYNVLIKYFRKEARSIPYEYLELENYEATISNTIKIGSLYNAYLDMYNLIGTVHGERVGKGINRDIKDFSSITFQSEWQRNLFNWILDNVGFRIVSVRSEFIKYIQRLVAESFSQGLSTRELAVQIHKLINRRDFYRWEALRIARTESTLAANRAGMVAAETSGLLYDKVWVSIPDARTRRKPEDKFDHLVMDGVQIPKDDFFNVQGELIAFPGSDVKKDGTRSSAGNVINCRCTAAVVVRRDSNGRIIRI